MAHPQRNLQHPLQQHLTSAPSAYAAQPFLPALKNNMNSPFRLDEGYSEDTRSQSEGDAMRVDPAAGDVEERSAHSQLELPDWVKNLSEVQRSGESSPLSFNSAPRSRGVEVCVLGRSSFVLAAEREKLRPCPQHNHVWAMRTHAHTPACPHLLVRAGKTRWRNGSSKTTRGTLTTPAPALVRVVRPVEIRAEGA